MFYHKITLITKTFFKILTLFIFNFRLIGTADLETICVTVSDYFDDYKHLRPHIFYNLMKEILYKVVAEFIIGIDSRFFF